MGDDVRHLIKKKNVNPADVGFLCIHRYPDLYIPPLIDALGNYYILPVTSSRVGARRVAGRTTARWYNAYPAPPYWTGAGGKRNTQSPAVPLLSTYPAEDEPVARDRVLILYGTCTRKKKILTYGKANTYTYTRESRR